MSLLGGATSGANEADPIYYLDPGGSTGCPGVVFDGTPKTGDIPMLVDDSGWVEVTVGAVFEIPTEGNWSFMLAPNTSSAAFWNFGGNSTHWWVTSGAGDDIYTAENPVNWWGTPHFMLLSADMSGDAIFGYFNLDGTVHISGEVWGSATPGAVVFGNTGDTDVIGHWWGIDHNYKTPLQLAAISGNLTAWMTTIGTPNVQGDG